MTELTPFELKDAPALIEAVYPAQKFHSKRKKSAKPILVKHLQVWGHTGKAENR